MLCPSCKNIDGKQHSGQKQITGNKLTFF
jgi:hypothetical protein